MFLLELKGAEDATAAAGAEALVAAEELPQKELLAAFRRTVHREPNDPDYYYILGSAFLRLGRHDDAVAALREALSFHPGDATYRRALGAALWRLRRFAESADAFREALRERPLDVEALNGLGLAHLKLGELRQAVDALGRAHAFDRTRADVRSNYAAALWSSGKRAQAERHFHQAVKVSPAHVPFRINLGRALLGLGRAREAVERFREALHYAPEDAGLLFDLGDACLAAGQASEAEEAWDRGALLNPALGASRTGSREARRALALERLRSEIEAEKGRAGGGWRQSVALAAAALRDPAWPFGARLPQRLVGFGLLAAFVFALRLGFAVLPHYLAHFQLRDDVARASRTATSDDSLVRERIMSAVRAHGRAPYISPEAVRIERNGRLRLVELVYEVPVELLPGWRRSVRFRIFVEEPVLLSPDPIFL